MDFKKKIATLLASEAKFVFGKNNPKSNKKSNLSKDRQTSKILGTQPILKNYFIFENQMCEF